MTFTTALALYALITLAYLLIEVGFTYYHYGFGYGFSSNRSTDAPLPPIGKRIKAAFQNQVESASYIVPVLGAAAALGLDHSGAEIAAGVIIAARALFGPLYYTGIPFIRIPAWGLGWMGSAYIAVILLTS